MVSVCHNCVLSFSLTQDNEVILMSTSNWTTDSIPSVSDMLRYLDCLEKCQKQTGDNKICFVSR